MMIINISAIFPPKVWVNNSKDPSVCEAKPAVRLKNEKNK
jgi:hypothetical protein